MIYFVFIQTNNGVNDLITLLIERRELGDFNFISFFIKDALVNSMLGAMLCFSFSMEFIVVFVLFLFFLSTGNTYYSYIRHRSLRTTAEIVYMWLFETREKFRLTGSIDSSH